MSTIQSIVMDDHTIRDIKTLEELFNPCEVVVINYGCIDTYRSICDDAAVSVTNLPADTPVRNLPSPRISVALTIPVGVNHQHQNMYQRDLWRLVAVTVPSAGVPILTAAPSAMIKIEVGSVGGFENVIWSFMTVYGRLVLVFTQRY